MKHIKLFSLLAAIVCAVSVRAQAFNPYSTPLTFEAMEAGATVTYSIGSGDLPPVEYSTDGSTWTSYSSAITLANIGDKVSFRGNNTTYTNNSSHAKFSCTADCYIYGNIMSLVDATDYATATTLSSGKTFSEMFYGNTHIKNHPTNELVLPATTLTDYCYASMFRGCTGLTSAPILPATTLASSCYYNMFRDCTGLTTLPENMLPATTLANNCYQYMFRACTGLTSAPALPATTLATECYHEMFYGCTGLTSAPILPATTLAAYCYSNMFRGCTGLTSAPILPATTLAAYCYSNMFRDCTGLTTLPENMLPATTLAEYCYQHMFRACTGLTSAPILPATTLANRCYQYMFANCTNLSSVTCYATVRPNGIYDTYYWLTGVAASGTFYAPIDNVFADQDQDPLNIPSGWTLNIIVPAINPYSTPLTFEAMEAGATVTYSIGSGDLPPVEYSTDGSTWTSYSSAITLANIGDKVSFRGNNTTYYNNSSHARFGCTADCYIYGNIMSLVDATGYATATTLSSERNFMNMFYGNTHIKNHPTNELVLPATTLAAYCYSNMFRGCTGLTSAPALPATTLVTQCYYQMFYGCTGLTSAPALPATTLATECYQEMFYGCTGLTSVPALPATTLANSCYYSMFRGCTGLTSAPALPATTLVNSCYREMFYGCTGLTSVPALPATTLVTQCYAYMFRGCTGLTTLPENMLPATTLVTQCYYGMFRDCTGLTSAPALPATTLAPYCYRDMFYGCTALTSVPELPATTLAEQCYNSMFVGCTGLTSVPALPATTLVTQCYAYMFRGCTGLTTLPENMLPATTLAERCYYYMFYGCTGLTDAPALPATTLANQCYAYMFNGCTNLSSVTCYATVRPNGSSDTNYWLNYVAASGTFYAPIDNVFADQTRDASNIPSGWTLNIIVPAINPYSTPLTFEAMEAGATVTYSIESGDLPPVEYSTDGSTWASYSSEITLANIGDKVSFRGNNATYTNSNYKYARFSCTADCYIYGNIMSLVDATGYATATTLSSERTFMQIFRNNTHIKNHPTNEFVLPATTLTEQCYNGMFSGCTSLTSAPALPATTLTAYCYYNMFRGCTGLTTLPENMLPATTLVTQCYFSMFRGCTGLTTLPENMLPATTLVTQCYREMFYGCTGLTTLPENMLPATTLATQCYNSMFMDCTGLTSAPALPATTLAEQCYYSMFNGCTGLTSVPALPATTLAEQCYYSMFRGCTGLTTLPENMLPATTLVTQCYFSMFMGCTGLTSAPALPATTLTERCYYGMFYGCTGLTSAPALPATTLAPYCYREMFRDCTALTSVPELPATTLTERCYYGMFRGCTGLTTLPENMLPATTLAPYCYREMFYGCTGLTSAPILPATTLASNCYYYMFYGCTNLSSVTCYATVRPNGSSDTNYWLTGVAASGTFYAPIDNAFAGQDQNQNNIPSGWTLKNIVPAKEDPQNAGVYYSTLYHSTQRYALQDDGTEAYVGSLSNDALILTKIAEADQVLPENTAVIIKSATPNIIIEPTNATGVTFSAVNDLQGVDAATSAPANCYVLSGQSSDHSVSGVGFYQFSGTLGAHKAYLTIPSGSPAPKRISFAYGTTTDIEATADAATQGAKKMLSNGQLVILLDGVEYNAQGQIIR